MRSLLMAFFLIVPVSFSHAQIELNRIVKKYGIKQGLSQAVVNSIAQDDKGLMWFATDDGLNRFDGYTFTIFRYDTDTDEQFHDNFAQRVFTDSKGALWASSRRGLYQFNLSNQKLKLFLNKSEANDVSFISQAQAGRLWVGWYWGGIGSFDPSKEEYDTTGNSRLTSKATIVAYEDSYGYLWIGYQDTGLDVFKILNGSIGPRNPIMSNNEILPSKYVKCILEDHVGNVWIGTTRGLVVYLRSEERFVRLSARTFPSDQGVFSLYQDRDKVMWIGTQGCGLYTLPLNNFDARRIDRLIPHKIHTLDQYNVSQLTVRSIFQDRDNNIWIGTHGDGVYMIGSEERSFARFQTKKTINSAERYVSYLTLCHDADGTIWVGTDAEGLYRINKNGDVLGHYTADGNRGSITDNVLLSALRDHDDNLWFGSYSQGVFLYNRSTGKFENFRHATNDANVPLANRVSLLFEDSRKNIWVGASRGGLCQIDRPSKTFRRTVVTRTLPDIDVRALAEDKAGNFWLGSYGNGLVFLNPVSGERRPIFEGTGPENLLKSNVIHSLALDKEDNLWIATGGGGLGAYNLHSKELMRFTEKEGLINNTVFAVQIDDNGYVWVSTIKGISRIDPATKKVVNYTSDQGLQAGQFNPGASFNNRPEGYIGFGGAEGLNLFYPANVDNNTRIPDVMISGFQLFNKPVKVGVDAILQKVIDETETIVLEPDQGYFTFEFTALNYNSPENNKYAYKLVGLEKDWNYAGNQRTASYRYLRPGSYEFRVKAADQNNEWPEKYASVRIEILPPFWKTPVAFILYVIVLAAAMYGIAIVRKRQHYLKRRLIIEKEQRKRERQMVQEKLGFFTEVSHEFRTPLTLIIGPLEEMLSKESHFTPTGKKLKLVYKNAHKLLTLINKLLDYRKVETGNMVLRLREADIVAFTEEIYLNFRELASRKKIHFDFCADPAAIPAWFDREKIEMVLNNVISNSIKYIGNGRTIKINLYKEMDGSVHGKVVIEVKDDGVGIPPDKLKYIFDWFYHGVSSNPISSGIGLALAKKLVYLHKGQITVTSKEGYGSTFTIKMPVGKERFEPHEAVIDEGNPNLLKTNPLIQIDPDEEFESSAKKGLKTILLVEDHEEVRSFLRQFFEGTYRILEADNGNTGLELAIEHNPDLIISDIMMPAMNGIELCKAAKANIRTSHIPIVLLTAKTAYTHHKEGLEIGADAYVTKPFSPEMLGLTVNNLLQSREKLKRYYRSMFITGGDKLEAATPDEKLLQRIHELLKKNLDKTDFNLDNVCDDLAISRTVLYKKIKSLTGQSPVEYIRSLRLAEAASLLKSQSYKVFEVVYMVGFTDLKYFRQCFIKEFGYPPSQLIEKPMKLKLPDPDQP